MRIQVLVSPGCGHGRRALDLVREVVGCDAPGAEVETVQVATVEEAERLAFRGSPTILVNGIDIDAGAPKSVGLG